MAPVKAVQGRDARRCRRSALFPEGCGSRMMR